MFKVTSRSPRALALGDSWNRRTAVVLLMCMALQLTGCSRRFWRRQAENDTYRAISEKQNDPHWQLPRMDLTPDVRSRFYDPFDPDCAPLPPDDPASHQFMHCADGKEGYKGWHDFGDTLSVENPHWVDPYTQLMESGNPVSSHQYVEIPKVNLRDSLELTYIHSREFQTQLEDVYLTALQLTEQRYLLNTRFNVNGPGLGGNLFRFGRDANGNKSYRLDQGIGITQTLPAGQQLAVSVLNGFTWNSQGGFSATALAWSLSQPLLELAGRKIRMEGLVQSERNLLAQVREMARFRQTIFVRIANDYLRLQAQNQRIRNRLNNIRQLRKEIDRGTFNESIPFNFIVQKLVMPADEIEIPDSLKGKVSYDGSNLTLLGQLTEQQEEDLLAISDNQAFQVAAEILIELRQLDVTSLSISQLITRLNTQESQLEGDRRVLADQLDAFKVQLGLPPNVDLTIDDQFLNRFELIDGRLLAIVDEIDEYARVRGPGIIPSNKEKGGRAALIAPDYQTFKDYTEGLWEISRKIETMIEQVRSDFQPVRDVIAANKDLTEDSKPAYVEGRQFQTVEEKERVESDIVRDMGDFRLNKRDFDSFAGSLAIIRELLAAEDQEALLRSLDADGDGSISANEAPSYWTDLPDVDPIKPGESLTSDEFLVALRDSVNRIREKLLRATQGLQVVQAGLRVEALGLNPFRVPGFDEEPGIEQVIEVGLKNRRDLMNARAAVVDARRQVEIAANRLKSAMNLDVNGVTDLDGGNATDSVNVTLDFKTPLDKVAQRNDYNAALIAYQRARRTYMAAEDGVKQEIRASWRQLRVSRQQLEIDRQTVRNAAKQYDNVTLNTSQQNSLSLLNALDAVLRASNSLIGNWISYETNRLNIFRDMGIMTINEDGVWEDSFYLQDGPGFGDTLPQGSVLTPASVVPVVPDDAATTSDVPADNSILPPGQPAVPGPPQIAQ